MSVNKITKDRKKMEFRPCIDIHNGKVKQIVGSSLRDEDDAALENFVAEVDAAFYADMYRRKNIKNGHVILLNHPDSEFYEATKNQALAALEAYRGGLQVGGGITDENAASFLQAGASHVIVTSFVFKDGLIDYKNLEKLVKNVGRDRLVLDLSCKKKNGAYYIVTDRWQKYTDVVLNSNTLDMFSEFCDEFLIHAADVEGKAGGIDEELVRMLGGFDKIPVTYAGGVHTFEDIEKLKKLGNNKVNVTIGSALDIFGGNLKLDEVLKFINE